MHSPRTRTSQSESKRFCDGEREIEIKRALKNSEHKRMKEENLLNKLQFIQYHRKYTFAIIWCNAILFKSCLCIPYVYLHVTTLGQKLDG